MNSMPQMSTNPQANALYNSIKNVNNIIELNNLITQVLNMILPQQLQPQQLQPYPYIQPQQPQQPQQTQQPLQKDDIYIIIQLIGNKCKLMLPGTLDYNITYDICMKMSNILNYLIINDYNNQLLQEVLSVIQDSVNKLKSGISRQPGQFGGRKKSRRHRKYIR